MLALKLPATFFVEAVTFIVYTLMPIFSSVGSVRLVPFAITASTYNPLSKISDEGYCWGYEPVVLKLLGEYHLQDHLSCVGIGTKLYSFTSLENG